MNIAMILEMAADTFGDRVAVSDGQTSLSYVALRRYLHRRGLLRCDWSAALRH